MTAPIRVIPDAIVTRHGGTMVDDYLTELAAAGQSAGTIRLRRYQLEAWIRHVRDPLQATRSHAVGWMAQDMSANTRASKRAALEGRVRA